MNDPEAKTAGTTLRAGDLRLVARPDLGGSLAGLWHRGRPVLRSCEAGELEGPRKGACFPLLPYSNRLGFCRFEWRGRKCTTRPNFENSLHSLHGVGWLRAWEVCAQSTDALDLRLSHAPDADWPFAFEAKQRIRLTGHSLRLEMRMTNTDMLEQPAGLGWHPYFPKRAESWLHIDVDVRWEADEFQLPVRAVAQPGLHGMVSGMAEDHCFGPWRTPALIEDECFSLRLSASVPWLVVFTPPTLPHFCVEPVSHVNNAIAADDFAARGLVALAPGQSLSAWMELGIEPR